MKTWKCQGLEDAANKVRKTVLRRLEREQLQCELCIWKSMRWSAQNAMAVAPTCFLVGGLLWQGRWHGGNGGRLETAKLFRHRAGARCADERKLFAQRWRDIWCSEDVAATFFVGDAMRIDCHGMGPHVFRKRMPRLVRRKPHKDYYNVEQ